MTLFIISITAGISVGLLTWVVFGPKVAHESGPSTLALLFPSMSAGKSDKGLSTLILEAGSPAGVTPETVQTKRLVGGVLGALIGLAFALIGMGPFFYLMAPVLAFIGWYYPTYQLTKARAQRIKATGTQLPEALDLLRVKMSTGDNIVPAIRDVARRMPPGVMQGELQNVVNDIAAGRSLAESLRALAKRLPTTEVDSFARSVIQAEKLGADVATTLAAQATATRAAREARIDKSIASLSGTMILPLFANVAGIMLLILAPSMSQILTAFN